MVALIIDNPEDRDWKLYFSRVAYVIHDTLNHEEIICCQGNRLYKLRTKIIEACFLYSVCLFYVAKIQDSFLHDG